MINLVFWAKFETNPAKETKGSVVIGALYATELSFLAKAEARYPIEVPTCIFKK